MASIRHKAMASALGATGGMAGVTGFGAALQSGCATSGACGACFGCAGIGVAALVLMLYRRIGPAEGEADDGVA
jgi:Zn-dependent alcohol dehydrogenase